MLNERAAHSSRLLGILSITLFVTCQTASLVKLSGSHLAISWKSYWKIILEIIPFETLRKQNPTGRSSKSNKLMTNMV